jgi:DNA (cytosine-5)-methyltransferase 1
MGYHRAGFEVVGVDIEPQPNYPFKFIQADAVEFLRTGSMMIATNFDAIHASPPCQRNSKLQSLGMARNGSYKAKEHPDLIDPIRKLLVEMNTWHYMPYVIENVEGAELIDPIKLCGLNFGLKVYRHRLFESNAYLMQPEHIPHDDQTPSAGNGISPKGFISVCGTGGVKGMKAKEIVDYWSMAMGIDWMNRAELAQAIPPAFTEFIGQQLMEQLKVKVSA